MIFYFILENNGFDWNRAREIFYSLTEEQVVWISRMIKRKYMVRDRVGDAEVVKSFRLR